MEEHTYTRAYNGGVFPVGGEYDLDPDHTFLDFATQHIIVGQVHGRFNRATGMITIVEDPAKSSVEVTVETATISTNNEMRDKDLKSERFFDVEKFPFMTFRSITVTPDPRGHWAIEGMLTIKGTSKQVTLMAKFNGITDDPWGNTRVAFEAKAKINRKDFGLLADIERETGGLPIGKDIMLSLAAEAIMKKSIDL